MQNKDRYNFSKNLIGHPFFVATTLKKLILSFCVKSCFAFKTSNIRNDKKSAIKFYYIISCYKYIEFEFQCTETRI